MSYRLDDICIQSSSNLPTAPTTSSAPQTPESYAQKMPEPTQRKVPNALRIQHIRSESRSRLFKKQERWLLGDLDVRSDRETMVSF